MLTARSWEKNTSKMCSVLLLLLLVITFVALFLAGHCRADEWRSGACELLLAGGTSQVRPRPDPGWTCGRRHGAPGL